MSRSKSTNRKIGKPVYPGKVEYLSRNEDRGKIVDVAMWMNLAEIEEQTINRGDRGE